MEHLLIEHIGGYELFELKEFESLRRTDFNEYMVLSQAVNHLSSFEFGDSMEVLEQMKYLENGQISQRLENFLLINNVKVLHSDKSLRMAIQAMGIEHKYSPNIARAIRLNIKKITKKDLNKQLVLSVSHSYSKMNIKYDMEREDNVVITTDYELEHLEADIELLKLQIYKMVEWNFPEYSKILMKDTEILYKLLAKNFDEIKTNDQFNDDAFKTCKEIISDLDESDIDLIKSTVALINEKRIFCNELENYLEQKLKILAPNLRQILGDRLCFKLIHKAGGMTNLCLKPSSTLQLLGAEKALFTCLKRKSNRTPKHGLLFNLKYLKEHKGKMCRYIASKCSIAARIDCFNDDRTDEYGKELMKLINRKIKNIKGKGVLETTEQILEKVKLKIDKQ